MIILIIFLLILLWIPCSIRMALKQIETWKINKERHGKYFPTNKEKYGKYFPTRQDKRMYEQMWFEKKANSPQPPSKNLEAHKDKPEKIEAHKDMPKFLQQMHDFFHQPISQAFKIKNIGAIFTIGLIILLFTLLLTLGIPNVQTQKPLTIGVSHGQIMMHLDSFILLSKRLFTDKGEPRYMGSTTDHLAQVEIIGNENDVLEASVAIWVPNDAPEIIVRNSGIFLRFIKNTVPEWEGGGDWLNSALDRIMSTKKKMGEEKIIIGSKAITLFVAPPTITVVVKHKDAIKPLSKVQTQKPLTIGVSYDQIMMHLDKDISLLKSPIGFNGQPSYDGRTSDKSVLLEIVGDKKDVSRATLIIRIPKDAKKISSKNIAIVVRFLKNVVPEWESSSDWATSALEREPRKSEKIIIGNKLIIINFLKPLGMVNIWVTHKDAI